MTRCRATIRHWKEDYEENWPSRHNLARWVKGGRCWRRDLVLLAKWRSYPGSATSVVQILDAETSSMLLDRRTGGIWSGTDRVCDLAWIETPEPERIAVVARNVRDADGIKARLMNSESVFLVSSTIASRNLLVRLSFAELSRFTSSVGERKLRPTNWKLRDPGPMLLVNLVKRYFIERIKR